MTPQEWADLSQHITAKWPHQPPPMETLAAWFEDVRDLDAVQVRAAISSFARDGREWPPTGGMLRKRVFELALDAPTFGEVWRWITAAAQRFGYSRRGEAMEALAQKHAMARQLAEQVGWRDVCHEMPTVVEGQAARIFGQLVERTTRDLALTGLPGSGLAAIERANGDYAKLAAATLRQMPSLGRGDA